MPNQIGDVGNPGMGNPFFVFGNWNLPKIAREIAYRDPLTYQSWGGNLDLYPGGNTYYQYVSWSGGGGEPKPLVDLQLQDAKENVCPWMSKNLQAVYDEENSLGMFSTAEQNFTGNPNLRIPYWNASDDMGAIFNGVVKGGSPDDGLDALIQLGYDPTIAADMIMHLFAHYDFAVGNVDYRFWDAPGFFTDYNRKISNPEALEFLDQRNGLVGGMQQGEPRIPIGNEFVWIAMDKATAKGITDELLKTYPNLPWVQLLKRQQTGSSFAPELRKYAVSPTAQYNGAFIGASYLTWAYRLKFGDPRDSGLTLLEVLPSNMRFEAVPIEAKWLTQKIVGAAIQNKITYSFDDYIGPAPVDPALKIRLGASKFYSSMIHFPTRFFAWYKVGYNGANPLVLAGSEPNVEVSATADNARGMPQVSSIGRSSLYVNAFEEVWRADVCRWAISGGWQMVDFSNFVETDQFGNQIPSEFGTVLYFPRNVPDGTPALLNFKDNTQYGDIAGALAAGDATDVQCANVFEMSVVSDPALRQLLGLVPGLPGGRNQIVQPNPTIANDFYSIPNMATIRDAWLRSTPKVISVARGLGQK